MSQRTLLPVALILLGACADAPTTPPFNFEPETFETEAGGTVDGELGPVTDFPYPDVCEAWGIEDLGEEFHSPVESSIPVLFVSGDLGGRTPSHTEEIISGFPNSAHTIVEQVGHEGFVFVAAPELIPMIGEFFSGSMPDSAELAGLPLVFSRPSAQAQ